MRQIQNLGNVYNTMMDRWHSLTLERFLRPLSEHSQQLGGLNAPSLRADSSIGSMMELFLKSKSEALVLEGENSIIIEAEVFKQLNSVYQNGGDFTQLTAREFALPMPIGLSDTASILDGLRYFYRSSQPFFIQRRDGQIYLFSAKDLLQFFIDEFSDELEAYQLSAGKMRTQLAVQSEDYFLDTSKVEGEIGGDIFLIPLSRLLMGKFIRQDEAETIAQTLKRMREDGLSCSLVMQYETTLRGILTNRDLFRSFLKSNLQSWNDFELWSKMNIDLVMTAHPDTLGLKHSMAHGLCLIHSGGYRQFIIVDEEKIPLGIITLSDLLRFIARYLPDDQVPDQA